MPQRSCPPSQAGAFRRIWAVVARIPRGCIATYGQVARMAGFGGGARTAGWALPALPGEVRIGGRPVPWHRVVNARGMISDRMGSDHGSALARQAARLRREGVVVSPKGGIDLERYLWGGRARRRSHRPRGRSGAGA